jgi:hypothetical protein
MLAAIVVVALALPATAAAHVEIVSTEAGKGALYTVTSPNENAKQAMTGLRLTVPDGLQVDAISDAGTFSSEIVRDQSGKAVVLSWQRGSLAPEHLGLFQFSGHLDSGVDKVTLNGTQTFADGSTEKWTPQIASSHSHGSSDNLSRGLAIAAIALAAVALAWTSLRRRRPAA